MKKTNLLSLIATALVTLSQAAWAAVVAVAVASTEEVSVVVSAAAALLLAVFVAVPCLPSRLEAEP